MKIITGPGMVGGMYRTIRCISIFYNARLGIFQ